MKNSGGFVKIYRNLPKWRWYSDDITFRVFMHLLLTAQYKDTPWQERVLREGQAVTGSQKLADDLGLSRQQVRTALRKLQATNSITIETTNKYSVITVTNWQKYQKDECSAADTSTKALTDEQPTDNHRATNDQPLFKKEKKDKKDKKDKNERESALVPNGTFCNVLLTEKCGGANVYILSTKGGIKRRRNGLVFPLRFGLCVVGGTATIYCANNVTR